MCNDYVATGFGGGLGYEGRAPLRVTGDGDQEMVSGHSQLVKGIQSHSELLQ